MTRSPLLDSFDPFATHPFTNNSGLNPSHLSSPILSQSSPTQNINPLPSETLTPDISNVQTTPSFPKLQKQPVSSSSSPQTIRPPVFSPFRLDTSSPDLENLELVLVLKKKPPK